MQHPAITAQVNRPFQWSYSRLKNFEVCPLRHYEIDLAKHFQEGENEVLQWGNEVHKAAELYIKEGRPLPVGMPALQDWLDRIKSVPYEQILVEQKLAITEKFEPCGYFDSNVWFRSKADFLGIKKPVALALDYKTGKVLEDAYQLALLAACVFANFPDILKVRTEFVWLKEGPNVSTREDFARDDMVVMWRNIWPRIEALKEAYATQVFPPKPNKLCARWCAVTSCPHNGRASVT